MNLTDSFRDMVEEGFQLIDRNGIIYNNVAYGLFKMKQEIITNIFEGEL